MMHIKYFFMLIHFGWETETGSQERSACGWDDLMKMGIWAGFLQQIYTLLVYLYKEQGGHFKSPQTLSHCGGGVGE